MFYFISRKKKGDKFNGILNVDGTDLRGLIFNIY